MKIPTISKILSSWHRLNSSLEFRVLRNQFATCFRWARWRDSPRVWCQWTNWSTMTANHKKRPPLISTRYFGNQPLLPFVLESCIWSRIFDATAGLQWHPPLDSHIVAAYLNLLRWSHFVSKLRAESWSILDEISHWKSRIGLKGMTNLLMNFY